MVISRPTPPPPYRPTAPASVDQLIAARVSDSLPVTDFGVTTAGKKIIKVALTPEVHAQIHEAAAATGDTPSGVVTRAVQSAQMFPTPRQAGMK